jgi:hypothetical protein
VDDTDLLAADLLSMLEGEPQHTLAGLAGNEFDALDNAIDNNVLNARVLALGVLTDQDSIDVIVGGLVAGNRTARSQIGEEVECASESEVERYVALANGRLFVISGCCVCSETIFYDVQPKVPSRQPYFSQCFQW